MVRGGSVGFLILTPFQFWIDSKSIRYPVNVVEVPHNVDDFQDR